MNDDQLTTIQVSVTAREMLRQIAKHNRRSMKSQAAWMFERELAKIELERRSIDLEMLENVGESQ